MKNKILGVLTAMTLCACGGGGGGDSSGAPTASVYTPSAAVLAARQANYPTRYWGQIDPSTLPPGTTYAGDGKCGGTDMSTTAYVLPNTITYAAKGVSELSQQQAAEYAEKAILEIKTTLGLSSSVGYSGQPIQICTQSALVFGFAQGSANMMGLQVTSSDSVSLDNGYLSNDFDMYKKLIKHELVHNYQAATLGTDNALLETWFAEGMAEFIASGKSAKSKTEILNLVNTQNPIDITSTGMVASGNLFANYPAFQSVVAYLADSKGANNSVLMLPAFHASLKSTYATLSTTCSPTTTDPTSCNTVRDRAFTQAFESSFRDTDGSALKLRSGTNNLRDTLSNRLSAFLQ